MPILKALIPKQSFELVRDRIGEILADEITYQFEMHGEDKLNALVYIERFVPFDKSEARSAINVSFSRGDYSNKDARSSDGTYQYFIDAYASAHSSVHSNGDHAATTILHRLIGMVRAILENPGYRCLCYAPPFSCTSTVVSIEIADPSNDGNAVNQVQGRLIFSVRIPETVELMEVAPISQSNTGVKLSLTDKGFAYVMKENI